ncbi:MAG TPA: hypothetical protein VK187_00640 [Geobacteraceae bacterium]|nr:hypothetical protein [Geobacteraceae bacterium]
MKLHTLRQLLVRVRAYRSERRQKTNQVYSDYMEFWRAYYDR